MLEVSLLSLPLSLSLSLWLLAMAAALDYGISGLLSRVGIDFIWAGLDKSYLSYCGMGEATYTVQAPRARPTTCTCTGPLIDSS